MMVIIVICLFLFLFSFFTLLYIKKLKADVSLQKAVVIVCGIGAWSLIIALLSSVIHLTFNLIYGSAKIDLGVLAINLCVYAPFLGGLLYLNQVIDTYYLRAHFVQVLQFKGYDVIKKDIFVDLERRRVGEIYKETSGKSLPEFERQPKAKVLMDPELLKKEFQVLQNKPVRSIHLDAELAQLKAGKRTDVSESWKMNTLKRSPHPLCEHLLHVYIDPEHKRLIFDVEYQNIREEQYHEHVFMFRLRQRLYDMLQAIQSELWVQPYAKYFEQIECSCITGRLEGFDLVHRYQFMKISIFSSELIKRRNSFFDVGKLESIAAVSFANGNPIDNI